MRLETRVIKSVGWFGSTRMWMQLISWIATLILARLLTPEDYGLFGMALAVIGFFELLQEFGLGTAIVQRQNISKQQINAIFWIVVSASLVFTFLTFFGAGTVASYYEENRLVGIIRILSIIFFINSIGTVPYSLLTKEIDLKHRSLAQAYGVSISIVVSVYLAYMGFGVWALVYGHLIRIALVNALMFFFSKWRPSFELSFAEIGQIINFSLRVAGSSIVGRLSLVANPLIISKVLGQHALGIYSMADSLGTNNPFQKVSTSVINQVSFPIFSKLQKDKEQLRRYFLKITKYLAVIALPLQIGMFIVAKDAVLVLLSAKWLETVPLIQIFSFAGVFYVLPLPSGPMLTARGKVDLTLKFTIVSAFVQILAILIGSQIGLKGVAIAWFTGFSLMRVTLLSLGMREIEIRFGKFLENILPPFLATVLMCLVIYLTRALLPDHLAPVVRLCRDIGVGALTYMTAILILDRKIGPEIQFIVREMFSKSQV